MGLVHFSQEESFQEMPNSPSMPSTLPQPSLRTLVSQLTLHLDQPNKHCWSFRVRYNRASFLARFDRQARRVCVFLVGFA
jgi:hypothetical protein